jgi:hypothetical protein
MTNRRRAIIGTTIAVVFGLLSIPSAAPLPPPLADEEPFRWNQDERWLALEQLFREAAARGCEELQDPIDTRLQHGDRLLADIGAQGVGPDAAILDSIEDNTFRLGPMVGACLERLPEYVRLVTRTRSVVKRLSEGWNINAAKERLYRLLWGGRTAVEEVMLQGPADAIPYLVMGDDEPSATPSTRLLDVTIHSGDLLVSRGGAPTSALIAVGSDYPGHFSHVGLVHIDERTSLPSVIESNEHGVHVSTLDDYLSDVKLRVMILRLRSDIPELVADPMLPHRAAASALQRAEEHHIPYDFELDHRDESKMYCSEVPAWAYRDVGITLWMNISRISAPGTRTWLTDLGMRHFDLQEPSDLEYDPQLRVIAEWRDAETLYMDHVDNVVTEALLDGASRGDRLDYTWFHLPFVRVLKGYSVMLNLMGTTGPVPEGLSATGAALVLTLNRRHGAIKERVLELAEEFRDREGYTPPEWQLLRFAKQARDELGS